MKGKNLYMLLAGIAAAALLILFFLYRSSTQTSQVAPSVNEETMIEEGTPGEEMIEEGTMTEENGDAMQDDSSMTEGESQ